MGQLDAKGMRDIDLIEKVMIKCDAAWKSHSNITLSKGKSCWSIKREGVKSFETHAVKGDFEVTDMRPFATEKKAKKAFEDAVFSKINKGWRLKKGLKKGRLAKIKKSGKKSGKKILAKVKMSVQKAKALLARPRGRGRPTKEVSAKLKLARKMLGIRRNPTMTETGRVIWP